MPHPFTLYLGEQPLGQSDLENIDEGMGVVWGTFHPTPAYESVRPIFRRFANSLGHSSARPDDNSELARYYRERDALRLTLRDAAGQLLFTSFIHIEDLSEEAPGDPESLRLVVQIADRGSLGR
jgi:hypothetical protein